MSWATVFVEALAEGKRDGLSFEAAYKVAYALHGVSPREVGGQEGRLDLHGGEAWWRGVCCAAWHDAPSRFGGPSRMRLLADVSLAEIEDGSEACQPVSRKVSHAARLAA